MRLADAQEDAATDGATLTLPPALLRGDARLEALFAPFHECVLLHEALVHDGSAARATRLLTAEIRADRFDDVRALVRAACPTAAFEEKPSELDEIAAGTDWRERSGGLLVSLYRLFGGATSLHVTATKLDPAEAPLAALVASPLAGLAELVTATSFVDRISCSRSAKEAPQWHLQATLRDLRRFEEIAPLLLALGFEDRRGKYWHEQVILQRLAKNRWMAAHPGIDFSA